MPTAFSAAARRRPRLLVIGCGDVGGRLIALVARNTRVIAIARSDPSLSAARKAGALAMAAPAPTQRRRMRRLAAMAAHALIAMPPSAPVTAGRRAASRPEPVDPASAAWIAALRYAAHARLQRQDPLRSRVVYLSTTGVYGDRGGARVDETTWPMPVTQRAHRRLAVEQRLRRAARSGHSRPCARPGSRAGTDAPTPTRNLRCGTALRSCVIRLPGIYSAERLPLERVRNQDPVPLDDPPCNRIHAQDVARACRTALLRAPAGRLYNLVDDDDSGTANWYDRIARWLGLPAPPRLPTQALRAVMSPTRLSFLSESRRVDGQRLPRELKLRLQYPRLDNTLREASAARKMGPGTGKAGRTN